MRRINHRIFLMVIFCLLIPSVVFAEDYCLPQPGLTTIIDHQGEWYNITIYSDSCYVCVESGGYGDVTCVPCGNFTAVIPPVKSPIVPTESIPLNADLVPVFLIILPFLALFYIFSGSQEGHPIWGDILASAFGLVISAILVMWFIQGGITSAPATIETAVYELPSSLTVSQLETIQESFSQQSSILGIKGTGMMVISSVSTSELKNEMTVVVHTHDTIRQQYQDIGVAFLFMLLAVIFAALFLWSLKFSIDQIREQANDENDPENWRE